MDDGDLLGFAAPPPASELANGDYASSVDSSSEVMTTSSWNGSATTTTTAPYRDGSAMSTTSTDDDLPAFAKPPHEEHHHHHEKEAEAVTDRSLNKQESVNLLDFGGSSTGNSAHGSVNLLDFGSSPKTQALNTSEVDLFSVPVPAETTTITAEGDADFFSNGGGTASPTKDAALDLFGMPTPLDAANVGSSNAVDPFAMSSFQQQQQKDPFAVTAAPAAMGDAFANFGFPEVMAANSTKEMPVDTNFVETKTKDDAITTPTDSTTIVIDDESTKRPLEPKATPTKVEASPTKEKEVTTTTNCVPPPQEQPIPPPQKTTAASSVPVAPGETLAEIPPLSSDANAPTSPKATETENDPSVVSQTANPPAATSTQAPIEPSSPPVATTIEASSTTTQPVTSTLLGNANDDSKKETAVQPESSVAKKAPAVAPVQEKMEEPSPAKAAPTTTNGAKEATVDNASPTATTVAVNQDAAAAKTSRPQTPPRTAATTLVATPPSSPKTSAPSKTTGPVTPPMSPTIVAIPAAKPKPTHGDKAKSAAPTSSDNLKPESNSTDEATQTVAVTSDKKALTEMMDRIKHLENELSDAQSTIRQITEQNEKDQAEKAVQDSLLVELQSNLQTQMGERAEAEDKVRRATSVAKEYKEQLKALQAESNAKIEQLEKTLAKVTKTKSEMETELESIREERDEQARKESSLTLRLNAAKKLEAEKAIAAEHHEDQSDFLKLELESLRSELAVTAKERDQLKEEVTQWKEYAESRTKQLERALAKEKQLNVDRKRKMKEFVEAKTEEVRSAKADNLGLQTEMDQTNMTLKDLNQRYKQLHAQWVQSQTHNRELQRDITKMQKDSEKMSKVGGTLEAKLSRSAMESEDHKNKRLAAKNELMAVLRQLEAERDVNNRLRERIKNSFTPKTLSQQQSLQDLLDDLEGAMLKVATKLGRPLPPPAVTSSESLLETMGDQTMDTDPSFTSSADPSAAAVSEANTQRVLNKLENETKRVSQCIEAVNNSIERLHSLVAQPSNRRCVDAFSALLLLSGGTEETTAMTGGTGGVRR